MSGDAGGMPSVPQGGPVRDARLGSAGVATAAWHADRLIEIDLATVEKLPVLAELLAGAEGPALDLGSGLGYYARRLLTRCPPVVVADLNLPALVWAGRGLLRCRADALRLPFPAATFGVVLLADVLEHCPEDRPVLAEIQRVLKPGGRLVLSVPSLEWGFPDFLALLGIPSVHDQEGPERHHTPGYTRSGLGERLAAAGLEVVTVRELFRLGPKILLDSLAVVHLVVERWGRRRRSWTWGSLIASPPPGLGLYRRLFPLVRGTRNWLHRASPRKGFELAVVARRPASGSGGEGGPEAVRPGPEGLSGTRFPARHEVACEPPSSPEPG